MESDLGDFPDLFRGCDICIIELANWEPKFRDRIIALSKGELNLRDFLSKGIDRRRVLPGTFNFAVYKLFAEVRKPVLIIDVPLSMGIRPIFHNGMDHRRTANALFRHGEYEAALTFARLGLTQMTNHMLRREDYILDHMDEQVQAVIDTTPGLAAKSDVYVVHRHGSSHTRLFHKTREKYPETTTRCIHPEPHYFGMMTTLIRCMMAGGVPSNLDVARMLVSDVLEMSLGYLTGDLNTMSRVNNSLVRPLDEEKIKQLCRDKEFWYICSDLGIGLPMSLSEYDDHLAKLTCSFS